MTIKTVNKCLIQAFKDGDVDWIIHQVNSQGVMGGGIAKQIKEEFPNHFERYEKYCNKYSRLLGTVFSVDGVVGVFGQDHYGIGERHTNYAALLSGLDSFMGELLAEYSDYTKIGIPHGIGCGLGGGDWTIMRMLLEDLQKMYPEIELVFYHL